MADKIVKSPTSLDVIDTINQIIDDKQDVLTASTGITITQSQDTRSTASIVTVGSKRWQGVAYGNGVYVAVGNDGYVAYSSDGSTWSTPTQVGTQSWYSITFANGKFVAVGNTGYTTTTTDGVTWTTPVQVSGLTQRLQSVRYGNGVFLAVGYDGKSTTSTDGATWTTPVTIYGNDKFMSVVFNGSEFIAIANFGRSYSSSNGQAWTFEGDNDVTTPASIVYGNGKYVCGGNTGQVSYSADLTTWSTPVSILKEIESIYFDGVHFIAVGRRQITSTTYKYSTVISSNGITWDEPIDIGEAASSAVITYGFLSITYGNGVFVAVGDSGATTTFTLSQTKISANIDDTLSSSSENPVQNKVIYAAIGDIETILHNLNSGSGVQ